MPLPRCLRADRTMFVLFLVLMPKAHHDMGPASASGAHAIVIVMLAPLTDQLCTQRPRGGVGRGRALGPALHGCAALQAQSSRCNVL